MLYTAVFICTVNETGGVVYSSVYLYSQRDWGLYIWPCLPVQSKGLGVMSDLGCLDTPQSGTECSCFLGNPH